jgi:hypothetical protein
LDESSQAQNNAETMNAGSHKLKDQGYVETLMFLPRPIHDHIIKFQKEHNLLTRGHAVAQLLEQVISRSNGRKRRE